MNYVIWNGKDSRTVSGLLICELPPISKPAMRVNEIAIDGVDGSIFEDLGYESYNKVISIGLTRNFNIDEIIKYFSGEGNITFSNEADKYYKAKIIGQIDYARLIRFRVATVAFRVQPFKYREGTTVYESLSNSLTVTNEGNYFSKPILGIKGSGTIKMSINGMAVFNYTFPTGEDNVIIDSQKQDAYLGIELKNRNMQGEFPVLETGSNVLSWEGSIESISITSQSRWL